MQNFNQNCNANATADALVSDCNSSPYSSNIRAKKGHFSTNMVDRDICDLLQLSILSLETSMPSLTSKFEVNMCDCMEDISICKELKPTQTPTPGRVHAITSFSFE